MDKRTIGILGLLIVVAGGTVAVSWSWLGKLWASHKGEVRAEETVFVDEAKVSRYIELLPRVVELTGIRTAKATPPTRKRKLELRGQLSFDPDSLVHIHGRFPGQIIRLAQVDEPNAALSTQSLKTKRDISFMDHVIKGQVLGELWSKELGEKKSELVSALIRLRVDQQNLKQYLRTYREAAAPEKTVREAQRLVEQDETDVEKARMTMRSWLLSTEEIDEVAAEAERLHREPGGGRLQGGRRVKMEDEWAKVDIKAPRDGTIVEKNVVEGDIVDTDADLFKLADMSRLLVVANVYEEDLRYLEQVPRPVPWTITINSMPNREPIAGYIDRFGEVIDPKEHVALLFGRIDNPREDLRVGQFIKAAIEIPERADVVEIPTRALVEDGSESVVLVRIDKDRHRYESRRVIVWRRYHDIARVRSKLTDDEREQGFEELHEGEEVVAVGALELKAALMQQQ
ncbi:MAG TPA: efflux RND transporter periplasmic adaptor subunit [Pirellulales bacterium]|jgi:cobalt-zinc-cadmium efflux system membrane fusion protein|nr:efflux RND transporter periplasmic adaptor subunit [Pirellulales bacterium]